MYGAPKCLLSAKPLRFIRIHLPHQCHYWSANYHMWCLRRTQRHKVSLRRQCCGRGDIFPRYQDPGVWRHRLQQVHPGYKCPWHRGYWEERHWQWSVDKSHGKLYFSFLAGFRFDNGNSSFGGNYHLDFGELLWSHIHLSFASMIKLKTNTNESISTLACVSSTAYDNRYM